MNRKKVRSLIEDVIEKPQPESVIAPAPEPVIAPAPEPVIAPAPESVIAPAPEVLAVATATGSADAALRLWTRTPQWEQNTTLRGINPQRLHAVMQSRVEAAFRAGYAAGVGDAI